MSYVHQLNELRTDPIWAKLEADHGHSTDGTDVYTASMLNDVATCPWQAKLKYLDQVPEERENIKALRGTVIHQTANRIHRENAWNSSVDLYREIWGEVVGKANLPDELFEPGPRSPSEHDKLQTDGETMVTAYVERNRNAYVEATEIPFRMLLQGPDKAYRFAGTQDQLRRGGGPNPHPQIQVGRPLEVWDLKSGAAAPSPAFLHRNKQLGAYGLAVEQGWFMFDDGPLRFGEQPERLVWYHLQNLVPYKRKTKGKEVGELRGDPVYETHRTPADYALLQKELIAIITQVRNGIWWRAESNFNCSMCRVSRACMTGEVHRPIQDADLTDLEAFGV